MPVTVQDTLTTQISGALAGQWLRTDHVGLVAMRALMPKVALEGKRGLFTISVTYEQFPNPETKELPRGG